MHKTNITKLLLFISILLSFFNSSVFASVSNGTIDSSFKYAWGENIGWINFACDSCDVSITDSVLSGYAWSSKYGWINLSPANPLSSSSVGVRNNGEGVLSGNAWGSSIGWIDFSGVTIGTNGDFIGKATVKFDNSKINFNCDGTINSCSSADFKVKTDWRPLSTRNTTSNNSNSSGSIIGYKNTVVEKSSVIQLISDQVFNTFDKTSNFVAKIFKKDDSIVDRDIFVAVPKNPQLVFSNPWNLLPTRNINSFVFAPLPRDIKAIAVKFPEIGNTLKEVGVEKFSDVERLQGVALNIPRLSDVNKKLAVDLGVKNISLTKGLPIDSFPDVVKQKLPTEFVFARANNELIDLNVEMSISDSGKVTQTINSLPGETLKLVVKPVSKPRSVSGILVFKDATPKVSVNKISRASLTASAMFSMNGVVENEKDSIPIEKKLVMSSFNYSDPDNDGIYTADVLTPSVPGEYEVVTIIDYVDLDLGVRRMSMITVIDPEGYIYEKNNDKETRIPNAIVSIYKLNKESKEYELWNAKDYQQSNPQITDLRGTYSFLVPEGLYYLSVEAPGYKPFEGKVFEVVEGNGVHENIEMGTGSSSFLDKIDTKTLLLVVVILLLMYNLFRDSQNIKLLKFFKKNE